MNITDIDRVDNMNRVSADVHYQIAKGMSESDAEGTIRALVEKYPGIVMRVLSQVSIRNLATLEALDGMMQRWRA